MDNLGDDISNSGKSDSKNDELTNNPVVNQKLIIVDKLEQNNNDLDETSENQSNNEIEF